VPEAPHNHTCSANSSSSGFSLLNLRVAGARLQAYFLLHVSQCEKTTGKGDTMKQAAGACVYRICGVSETQWDVLHGHSDEPVATFPDKHSALAYAMSLARGGDEWELPLTRRQQALGKVLALVPHSRVPNH
jgi:hypothetical protein